MHVCCDIGQWHHGRAHSGEKSVCVCVCVSVCVYVCVYCVCTVSVCVCVSIVCDDLYKLLIIRCGNQVTRTELNLP